MIPLPWSDARAIAEGAMSRAYSGPKERAAVARLIEMVRTRPAECCTWAGHCMDCPHICPLGRKDDVR